MARFIIDYDTELLCETKSVISKGIKANMILTTPGLDEICIQYELKSVIDLLADIIDKAQTIGYSDDDADTIKAIMCDIQHLMDLYQEGVNFIVIII